MSLAHAILKRQRAAFLSLATIGLLCGGVESSQAQALNATTWTETISGYVDAAFDGSAGVDVLAPEDLSLNSSGNNWNLIGDVTFGTSGPPSVTVSMSGNLQSGVSSVFGGSSYAYVTFEFRVRQNAAPPVSVTEVPVTVHSSGSADATGNVNLYAGAFAYLDISSQLQGPLAAFGTGASNDPADPNHDSFDMTQSFSVPPGTVLQGEMAASAGVGSELVMLGYNSGATAFIDPVIEVADEIIPGTSSSYRDYFDIEFGSGYQIGNPTAVEQKTWSDLKALYKSGTPSR